ncbi:MAG: OpgC domain-containing protein [Actinomycetota bacterium]|nr:OpgC domain-containing protein [Actinomycetota bacterium]
MTEPAQRETNSSRDERLDLMRGVAMLFVVINHVQQPSWWSVLTVERLGLVTGAEVFVLVSGIVLGRVHARRVIQYGWAASARGLLRRAGVLYLTSLVIVLLVLMLRYVPGLEDRSLATYTADDGQAFDLYPRADEPWQVFRGVVLLVYGPGEFNIMGLYVVLLAAAPLGLWLLVRGQWALLVGLAVLGWGAAQAGPLRLLPSQFENAFTLLAWQLLFLLGLVVGYHWKQLAAVLTPRRSRALVLVASAVTLGGFLLAWTSPWGLSPGPRLPLLSPSSYGQIYSAAFDRRTLGIGRLVNVVGMTIAAYAALTLFPRLLTGPIAQALLSLGQATLYVFVVHLAFVLAVDNITGGPVGSRLLGAALHTVVLVSLVVMVRRRVLFGLIPR